MAVTTRRSPACPSGIVRHATGLPITGRDAICSPSASSAQDRKGDAVRARRPVDTRHSRRENLLVIKILLNNNQQQQSTTNNPNPSGRYPQFAQDDPCQGNHGHRVESAATERPHDPNNRKTLQPHGCQLHHAFISQPEFAQKTPHCRPDLSSHHCQCVATIRQVFAGVC